MFASDAPHVTWLFVLTDATISSSCYLDACYHGQPRAAARCCVVLCGRGGCGCGDRDRAWPDFDLEPSYLCAGAAIEFVEHLAAERDFDGPCAGCVDEGGGFRCSGDGAGDRARPVDWSVGADYGQLEQSVVGSRLLEDLDAGEESPDVAEQDAARCAAIPGGAVDFDLGR